jgi:hypothetical protein
VANNVANVVAGKPLTTGGVLIAPLGTALPTAVATAPAAGFAAAGYIGDNGVTEGTGRSTTKVKAWGGDIVKILQTEFSVTYKFMFLESLNSNVLKAVYGDTNVTTTAATASTGTLQAVKINSGILPHKTMLFEVKDGPARVRIAVPDGQITEVSDVTYSDGEVIGYEVTVEAFQDASGNNAYKYSDDGVFTP